MTNPKHTEPLQTFQETIAEVLETLVSDASTYDWQSTDYDKLKADSKHQLLKALADILEGMKRHNKYDYDPSLGHQKSEDRGYNLALDDILKLINLEEKK